MEDQIFWGQPSNIKQATYLVRIKCDHPFCETRSEHEYPVDTHVSPLQWGSAGLETRDPDEQLHYCPEHKHNYCLDNHTTNIDGCGDRLSNYKQCNNTWCEMQGLSDKQYEKEYKDAWAKNAGVGTCIYCDYCNKIGGSLDLSDHLIDNGWEHARDYPDSDFCPDCWLNANFCHKCGDDASIGKYGQCTDCDATDEEHEKNYDDLWNKKSSYEHSGKFDEINAVCDYPQCNKQLEATYHHEYGDSMPDDWGIAILSHNSAMHFCPDHKGLFCLDDPYKEIEGCGSKLSKYGQCNNAQCEMQGLSDKQYEKEYKDSWGVNNQKEPGDHVLKHYKDAPNSGGKSASIKIVKNDRDPVCFVSEGEVDCPECTEKHFPGKDLEKDKLVDQYGNIVKPVYDHQISSQETMHCGNCGKYMFGYSTCGACLEDFPGDEIAWDNNMQMNVCPECDPNSCPKCHSYDKGKYHQCINCLGTDSQYKHNYENMWSTKKAINYFSLDQPNEAIMPGMAQTQVTNGAIIDDASLDDGLDFGSSPNPDSGMEDNVTQDFPGMHDYERGLSSAASKQAYIKIFCDHCRNEIPRHKYSGSWDPGNGEHYCDNCMYQKPEKYEELWKQASKYKNLIVSKFDKTAYYERITHCDECDKRSPDEDENLPRGWAKASGAKAGTAKYNHNNDEHYCEDCKKDRCLDEWAGYTMKNIGCGNKIGKYGQCTGCDRTDDQYVQEYNDAWTKNAYYKYLAMNPDDFGYDHDNDDENYHLLQVCDGCGLEDNTENIVSKTKWHYPEHGEYTEIYGNNVKVYDHVQHHLCDDCWNSGKYCEDCGEKLSENDICKNYEHCPSSDKCSECSNPLEYGSCTNYNCKQFVNPYDKIFDNEDK